MSTVGFPDSTVRENRDRVRAAIRNAGLAIPVAPITMRLAGPPAEREDFASRGPGMRKHFMSKRLKGREEVLGRPLGADVTSPRLAVPLPGPS